jgi:RNA-directed DNA polymerase
MNKAKPFDISKQVVYRAYLKVKENKGACGIDEQSITDFEADLKNNLYLIWNRMSSGTYFPLPTRTVLIPKKDKGAKPRKLAVPAVSDRIAQTVVKMYLEPIVEPKFHQDSYGYRPGKSAIEAVGTARTRCWRFNWCIDLDIVGFFDNLDHELILKAVRHHTDNRWILLYIERWLKAPTQTEDGTLIKREKGSSQGSAISPLLSNIFMHHAFCEWMRRNHPSKPFEIYADDALVHCSSLKEAKEMLIRIKERLLECKLELHPVKTKIVYCKDKDRKGSYEHEKFDFLGFTFRPRLSKNKLGKFFVNFTPAISNNAAKAIKQEIRSWRIHQRIDKKLEDIARMFNAQVRGWVNYYGSYYKSAMYPSLRNIERYLILWVCKKYKRFKRHKTRAKHWLGRIARREPQLFVHWKVGLKSSV